MSIELSSKSARNIIKRLVDKVYPRTNDLLITICQNRRLYYKIYLTLGKTLQGKKTDFAIEITRNVYSYITNLQVL